MLYSHHPVHHHRTIAGLDLHLVLTHLRLHHLEADDPVRDHSRLETTPEINLSTTGDYPLLDPTLQDLDMNHLDMSHLEITVEMTRETAIEDAVLVHRL